MFDVFCARGLSGICGCDSACCAFCWLSVLEGGELPLAWLRRSSVARSLASRASSSLAWVLTAAFLGGGQCAVDGSGRVGGAWEGVLFMDCPVEVFDAAVQLEETVELRHEVLC